MIYKILKKLKGSFFIKKKYFIIILFVLFFILISIKSNNLFTSHNYTKEYTNCKIEKSKNMIGNITYSDEFKKINKCYISPDNLNIKIIHLIITRFMIEYWKVISREKCIIKIIF